MQVNAEGECGILCRLNSWTGVAKPEATSVENAVPLRSHASGPGSRVGRRPVEVSASGRGGVIALSAVAGWPDHRCGGQKHLIRRRFNKGVPGWSQRAKADTCQVQTEEGREGCKLLVEIRGSGMNRRGSVGAH